MQGVDAVAQILKAEGVEVLFAYPNHPLIDAAALGIRPIIARSEKTLINMADGFTRAANGDRLGICAVQEGPGIENALAALEAGKHVLCKKPMAWNAADARRMRDAAVQSAVKHAVAFNYRFAPAVRLAREIVASGCLGRIYRLRISYLQDHHVSAEVRANGSSLLAGLGSNVIDLARFLVGEPKIVSRLVRTLVSRRPHPDGSGRLVDVTFDDAAIAEVEFANGVLGILDAAWVCAGRKNQLSFEVNGSAGSVVWDLEDLNRLRVYLVENEKVAGGRGFEDVLVTETRHPYCQNWWPVGHILGWEHLHANLIHHFVKAMATGSPVEPWGQPSRMATGRQRSRRRSRNRAGLIGTWT
jgi:predicted dehydrogenase